MDIKELFEKKYAMNAPSWSLEHDPDGSYKYHATQSAFVLFEQQQIEIESLKVQLEKAQAVPKYNASIDAHQWAIDEIKTEINDGYDLCQDSYLLDVLVERGIEIGKIQAVPEGYVVVPMEPTEQILNRMTNAPIEVNHLCDNADIFLSEDEARIAYKAMIEAQEPNND